MRWSGGSAVGRMTTDPSIHGDAACCASRGLHKRFGDHAVLRGIDLDVMPGDRIAILGASGSGKSTLLRCLNFMERPSAGVVELDGQAIGRAAPGKADPGRRTYDEAELTRVRQRVGMVFQQFNLFPHMTALGNVMEGLRTVRGQREAEARARAEAELARVGLADKAEAYPGASLGRAEAARRHRPRAGDGPRGAAVRRADLGARPRAGRRGAARDPRRSPRKAARCCW